MCTVTYIPRPGSYLLASNRDEHRDRPQAQPPALHIVNGQPMLFPRDGLAGGTWIAVNENGHALVLLNGAIRKHRSDPPYRQSRGLLLLDVLGSSDPANAFANANLAKIEPFTLIITGQEKLNVARWDGLNAALETADPQKAYIWSSATLYPEDVHAKRAGWFRHWLINTPQPDVQSLMDFHQFTGDGDPENDLCMHRSTGIFTNSISVLDCGRKRADFHYLDLRNEILYTESLSFLTSVCNRR